MNSTGTPTESVLPGARRNLLGRAALIVAIIQVLVSFAWTTVQPTLITQATIASMPDPSSPSNAMPAGLAAHNALLMAANITMFVLALVALILGIVACRRTGLPKVGGAIAIGVGGSTVVSYLSLLLGGLILTLVMAGSATP